jgi:hypothetical protein
MLCRFISHLAPGSSLSHPLLRRRAATRGTSRPSLKTHRAGELLIHGSTTPRRFRRGRLHLIYFVLWFFLFHCSHVLAADEVILGFRSYRRWVRFCWSSVSDSICSTRKHWFVLCFCANLPHVRCRGLFPPSLPTVVGESHFHDSFLPLPSMSIISLIRLPFLFLPLACWIWCGAPWRFFRSCCYRCWCDDWVGCWVKEHHLFSSPLLSPDDDWFIQVSTSTRWVVCPLMFYPFFQFYVDFCIF